jgi:hypothetical protein
MKHFLITLAVAFSVPAHASRVVGTTGVVQKITIGGHVFIDPYNETTAGLGVFKILVTNATTAGNYGTFRTFDGTAYQVPVGKKFYVYAARGIGNSAGAGAGTLCYGDTNVNFNSGSGPTNTVYYGGNNSTGVLYNTTAFASTEASVYMEMPASKYPCYFAANSQSPGFVYIYGYEK